MQILLACAKTMGDKAASPYPVSTPPRFQEESQLFALEMTRRSVQELMEMFQCSAKVASLVQQRYQRFTDPEATLPALQAYQGQAYRCLDAATLSDDDILYAQRHLWITSFLYGLLRPADRIHPYRMEGRVALEATQGQQLFDFWKPRLTDLLIRSVKADDGILLHLATKEMERLFDWQRVRRELRLIQPEFLMERRGKLAAVSVYAKSCRGAMTRFAIRHRITAPADLTAFSYEGFRWTSEEMIFVKQ